MSGEIDSTRVRKWFIESEKKVTNLNHILFLYMYLLGLMQKVVHRTRKKSIHKPKPRSIITYYFKLQIRNRDDSC